MTGDRFIRDLAEQRRRESRRETRRLNPWEELEHIDICCELAALDEEKTMFDPDTHPKPPTGIEEGVTSRDGTRFVDLQIDTPPIELSLNLLPPDPAEQKDDSMFSTPPIEEELDLL